MPNKHDDKPPEILFDEIALLLEDGFEYINILWTDLQQIRLWAELKQIELPAHATKSQLAHLELHETIKARHTKIKLELAAPR